MSGLERRIRRVAERLAPKDEIDWRAPIEAEWLVLLDAYAEVTADVPPEDRTDETWYEAARRGLVPLGHSPEEADEYAAACIRGIEEEKAR